MLAAGTIGALVPHFERAATAIAAGLVIGGFVGATRGYITARSRKEVEAEALRDGYAGAIAGIALLLLDLCIVYAT